MKRTPDQRDEDALIQAARENRDAFDALYRRYVTRVYRYCYSRVGDHADAEDLTARTFLAVLQRLSEYDGRGAFIAWLFSIAHHKCADHHRRRYARQAVPLEAACRVADADAVAPERRAYHNGLLECIRRALHGLSPDRREALRLRFWGGLKHQEVAAVMQRSEDAAKMLVWRAIADLRERCLDEND